MANSDLITFSIWCGDLTRYVLVNCESVDDRINICDLINFHNQHHHHCKRKLIDFLLSHSFKWNLCVLLKPPWDIMFYGKNFQAFYFVK